MQCEALYWRTRTHPDVCEWRWWIPLKEGPPLDTAACHFAFHILFSVWMRKSVGVISRVVDVLVFSYRCCVCDITGHVIDKCLCEECGSASHKISGRIGIACRKMSAVGNITITFVSVMSTWMIYGARPAGILRVFFGVYLLLLYVCMYYIVVAY